MALSQTKRHAPLPRRRELEASHKMCIGKGHDQQAEHYGEPEPFAATTPQVLLGQYLFHVHNVIT
eukprot:1967997-Amphidinium_carterae.1